MNQERSPADQTLIVADLEIQRQIERFELLVLQKFHVDCLDSVAFSNPRKSIDDVSCRMEERAG